jgi:CBS domain-containing membrane protein
LAIVRKQGADTMTDQRSGLETDELELSDEDILDAMQHIPGYLDISTEDFRIIYHLAWQHAMERLQARKAKG